MSCQDLDITLLAINLAEKNSKFVEIAYKGNVKNYITWKINKTWVNFNLFFENFLFLLAIVRCLKLDTWIVVKRILCMYFAYLFMNKIHEKRQATIQVFTVDFFLFQKVKIFWLFGIVFNLFVKESFVGFFLIYLDYIYFTLFIVPGDSSFLEIQ